MRRRTTRRRPCCASWWVVEASNRGREGKICDPGQEIKSDAEPGSELAILRGARIWTLWVVHIDQTCTATMRGVLHLAAAALCLVNIAAFDMQKYHHCNEVRLVH